MPRDNGPAAERFPAFDARSGSRRWSRFFDDRREARRSLPGPATAYRKAYAAFDAARAGPNAYDLLTAATRLETEGGAAVQKCAKDKGAFPQFTRRAQALANTLATP